MFNLIILGNLRVEVLAKLYKTISLNVLGMVFRKMAYLMFKSGRWRAIRDTGLK